MTKLFLDIDNPYANNTMYNDIMHSDSYSLPTANLSHCEYTELLCLWETK